MQRGLFFQIALRLVALSIVFALISSAIVIGIYIGDLDQLADDIISGRTKEISRGIRVSEEPGATALRISAELATLYRPGSGDGFRVSDAEGRTIGGLNQGSVAHTEQQILPALLARTDRERRPAGFRISGIRAVEVGGRPFFVEVSIRTRGIAPFLPFLLEELIDHVAIPFIPLSALLLIFNVLVVRKMLAPLKQAASDAEKLDPAHTGCRLTERAGPREVVSLICAVNLALERMELSAQRLREFSGNAAHELKTPLAVMTLAVDRLAHGSDRDLLRQDVAGMTRLVEQMLDMAQADALRIDAGVLVDLVQVGTEIVSQLLPLAISKRRQIEFHDVGGTSIVGHADAIGRALRNVVENALIHTAVGTTVQVSVGPGPCYTVQDKGPGIPHELWDEVFKRFWRSQHSDNTSAGLGLSIARSIIQAHGGKIAPRESDGDGACIRIEFPTTDTSELRRVVEA